jgi:4-aminobutyrate aminotransferase
MAAQIATRACTLIEVIPSNASELDDAASWRERDAAVIAPCYSRYSNLVVDRAEGAHLYTVDGRDILDFGSGIGVVNLGHNHPAVVAAARAQLDRLWHTSVTALNQPAIVAAEALVGITPPGLDQVFLCNSGAEAVEAAIKLARKATGRSDLIAFSGGFHGRTYGALSLTASKRRYRARIGPLLPGVHHVDYPYCFRCPNRNAGACCRAAGQDIERLLATRVHPEDVAAVFVEPVLGEGGYVVPPPEFMPSLRRLCDAHGILLVADEVQTGFGRTGRLFATEHTAVIPDIVCVAKAFGNGLPIGAMVASRTLMAAWSPGDHGSTFGGNAVACAAATAVVETMVAERLAERAARLGEGVLERAQGWVQRFPRLADARGLGFMLGLEFMTARGAPDATAVTAVRQAALERGLLLLSCGTDENVIRLVPPLTIPEDELDRGLGILEASLVHTLL